MELEQLSRTARNWTASSVQITSETNERCVTVRTLKFPFLTVMGGCVKSRLVEHQLHWISLLTQVGKLIGYVKEHGLQNGGLCCSKMAIKIIQSTIMLSLWSILCVFKMRSSFGCCAVNQLNVRFLTDYRRKLESGTVGACAGFCFENESVTFRLGTRQQRSTSIF